MRFVDMSGAKLKSADLRGADLYGANLKGANLTDAKGLTELLKSLKREGGSNHVGLIKYYNNLSKFKNIQAESWLELIGSLLNLIFSLIFQYWLKPFWLLTILVYLISCFAVFYLFALKTKRRKTGIWLILKKGRISKTTIKERPFKLTAKFPWKNIPLKKIDKINLARRNWDRMIRIGLYFSLLSAFNIGWRNVTTKSLITRLQCRDYTLRATGWARCLSGIQSLLSIFLIGLWLATYLSKV